MTDEYPQGTSDFGIGGILYQSLSVLLHGLGNSRCFCWMVVGKKRRWCNCEYRDTGLGNGYVE